MKLTALVIWVAAIFFITYGLAFAIAPSWMFSIVTGGELISISSLVDLRATYGGMTIAVGITILYLYRRGSIDAGLTIITVVLLSMAVTRLLGFIIDGGANVIMYAYFALEIGGAAVAIVAAKSGQNQ